MSKVLKVKRPENCIGCGLCILEASLLSSGTLNLGKSFIRVYGKPGKYQITVDYGKKTDFKEILEICPQDCFELENASQEKHFLHRFKK